jgi:hypothetical protein
VKNANFRWFFSGERGRDPSPPLRRRPDPLRWVPPLRGRGLGLERSGWCMVMRVLPPRGRFGGPPLPMVLIIRTRGGGRKLPTWTRSGELSIDGSVMAQASEIEPGVAKDGAEGRVVIDVTLGDKREEVAVIVGEGRDTGLRARRGSVLWQRSCLCFGACGTG